MTYGLTRKGFYTTRPPHGLLTIPGTYQKIFAGRAIVTGGPDEDGETTEATCTADDIAARVFVVLALSERGALCGPLRIVQTTDA